MYRLIEGFSSVLRISDGAFIPADANNTDYQKYLTWVAQGNTPLPAKSPEQIVAQMWERIKAKRDDVSENGGYPVMVAGVQKWFHSDTKSKTQQIGLVLAGVSVPPIPWKTMDGSFVPMTSSLAVAIFQAAMQKESQIFAVAEQHKAAMQASTDPLNYDYSTGWPVGFGG